MLSQSRHQYSKLMGDCQDLLHNSVLGQVAESFPGNASIVPASIGANPRLRRLLQPGNLGAVVVGVECESFIEPNFSLMVGDVETSKCTMTAFRFTFE